MRIPKVATIVLAVVFAGAALPAFLSAQDTLAVLHEPESPLPAQELGLSTGAGVLVVGGAAAVFAGVGYVTCKHNESKQEELGLDHDDLKCDEEAAWGAVLGAASALVALFVVEILPDYVPPPSEVEYVAGPGPVSGSVSLGLQWKL